MTSRYAHIHDATMQDKLSEYLKGSLIDVTGKAVPEEGMNDSADFRWFTRSVLTQALTNGYCAIPIVAGPLSTSERLPQLRSLPNGRHLPRSASSRTPRDGASHRKADANGWVRQSEMNERKRTSLINIVTALEAKHG